MSATTIQTTENQPGSAVTPLYASLLELVRRTSTILPDDVLNAIEKARKNEAEGSSADVAFEVIGCNIGLAKDKSAPICQDTGSILFFIHTPVGYDQITLEETATQAVREATKKGYLRQNSVDSITGKNTGDNTGPGAPVFHFSQWRKDYVEVKMMLKGGGRDLAGVENAILYAVLQAQGQGCAPGILGVCIGGDRATGYAFAKEQLLRTM